MLQIPDIRVTDFDYPLPAERIAQYPLEERDSSRLLVMENGQISEDRFHQLPDLLPAGSLLIFNETRVIRARLIFARSTGATIEIFCLEPLLPAREIAGAFTVQGNCTWKCLVGNVKRWKSGTLEKSFNHEGISWHLTAEKKEDLGEGCHAIEFSWEPAGRTFSEMLAISGLVPLPPYINRAPADPDSVRYQTVFARSEGSVAAPTAGLHFTEALMGRLREKNFGIEKVTLHVGAGTFRPVSSETIAGHSMHGENIIVSRKTISSLLENAGRKIIPVGTTSVRTLESLYMTGVKILTDRPAVLPETGQWDPYDDRYRRDIPVEESLGALLRFMDGNGLEFTEEVTRLMILPGYRFRLADAMITNFHMPKSTLLMLVAGFTGNDWRKAYDYALAHDFRFLSYGDACLFFRSDGNN